MTMTEDAPALMVPGKRLLREEDPALLTGAAEFTADVKNSTLAEYLVPAARDVPPIILGAAPAVMNTVVDALPGLGVLDVNMPASPNNVWHAIQAARTNNGGSQ